MRLIDADKIPWEEYYVPDPDSNAQWDYKKELSVLKPVVDQMPTVDAVELPCKIGDKVYRIDKGNYRSNWKPFVQELTVTEISWKKEKHGDKDLGFAIIADGIRYKFTSIGKSVFLTRKEAEAKMDGDGNG